MATNYGLIEEIQASEDDVIVEESNIAWDECIETDQMYEIEEVEALDECMYETAEIKQEKKPDIINLPVPKPQRRSQPTPIDPADDEKIRCVANMNCDICDKLLESLAQARAHFRTEHGMIGYLKCCDRKFKQRNRLLDHVNTHFNLTHACPVCAKNFDSKAYLLRHMVYHNEEKAYVSMKFMRNFD